MKVSGLMKHTFLLAIAEEDRRAREKDGSLQDEDGLAKRGRGLCYETDGRSDRLKAGRRGDGRETGAMRLKRNGKQEARSDRQRGIEKRRKILRQATKKLGAYDDEIQERLLWAQTRRDGFLRVGESLTAIEGRHIYIWLNCNFWI